MKLLLGLVAALATFPVLAQKADDAQVKRGRYLVMIGGCNDCHTAGYAPSGGKVAEAHAMAARRCAWLERSVGHHVCNQPSALHAGPH